MSPAHGFSNRIPSTTPSDTSNDDSGEVGAELAPSLQAQLGLLVDLRHPHLRNVVRIDAAGVHYDDDTLPAASALPRDDTGSCPAPLVATTGYAIASAFAILHRVGFVHGPLSIEQLRIDSAGHIKLEIDRSARFETDHRTQPDFGSTDMAELGGFLCGLLGSHPADPTLGAVVKGLTGTAAPIAEAAMHSFAVAGARATLPLPSDVTPVSALPPVRFLEEAETVPGRTHRLSWATGLAALVATGAVAVAVAAIASRDGQARGNAESGICNAAIESSCRPEVRFDRVEAQLTYIDDSGTHLAALGQPGDHVFAVHATCPGDTRLAVYRPSTHEVFLFEPPPEPQAARAAFVARDIDAAHAAVAC